MNLIDTKYNIYLKHEIPNCKSYLVKKEFEY